MTTPLTIEEINAAGRSLDPDGWIDITEIRTTPAHTPAPPAATPAGCCTRPHDEHPRGDATMFGTCPTTHRGIEVRLHWDGRRYVCGLCALDAFHATTAA